MGARSLAIDGVLLAGAVFAMSLVAIPAMTSSATFVDVESSRAVDVATAKLDVTTSGGLKAAVRGAGLAGAEYSKMKVKNNGTAWARFSLTSDVPADQASLSNAYRLDTTVNPESCDAQGFGALFQSRQSLGTPEGLPILGDPSAGADRGDQKLAPGETKLVCMRVWLPSGVGSSVTGATISPVITAHAEQMKP